MTLDQLQTALGASVALAGLAGCFLAGFLARNRLERLLQFAIAAATLIIGAWWLQTKLPVWIAV